MQATRGTPLSPAGEAGPKLLRRRRVVLVAGVAALVLAADAVSKALVVHYLTGQPPVRLAGGLLHLTLTRNSGAAFSIGTGATVVFSVIAVGVVVAIIRVMRRLTSVGWAIALGLLLGGALGNLGDRLFRAPGPFRGQVVDWIQLPHWPVFNLADASIVIGGLLILLLGLRGVPVGREEPGE